MIAKGFPSAITCSISSPFSELSYSSRQITHVLRTLTPLQPPNIATRRLPFNLHVLSTPPAFVLSQNQTLRLNDFVSYLFRPVTQSGALLPSCISIFKDHFRLLLPPPRFSPSPRNIRETLPPRDDETSTDSLNRLNFTRCDYDFSPLPRTATR